MLYITSTLGALALAFLSLECVYLMQSHSYFLNRGYPKIFLTDYFLCLVTLNIAVVCLELTFWQYIFFVQFALSVATGILFLTQKRKVKLRFTARVKRLVLTIFLLCFALCLLLPYYILPIFLPVIAVLGFCMAYPFEVLINRHFEKLAKFKLSKCNAVKIAIVGSFAKTSVKQILSKLLPDAMATPNSSNTPMGVCKFINTNDISHAKYLIFEMGARKNGDIAELCNLVNPTHAIFTGVTTQHLSTFKTFENIVATKQEVLELLPKEGIAVLNGKNDVALNSVEVGNCKKILAGIEGDFEATLTSADSRGSKFTLKKEGKTLHLCTSLLGKAHVENIALCLAFVDAVGEDFSYATSKLATLDQIPHRMEILKSPNATIIDDGYNANIDGIESCCQTLQKIKGKKIVIAQGIVEGGEMQCQLNKKAGQLLGKVCHAVVACGQNAQDISAGASEFCQNVEIVQNLQTAVSTAQKYYDETNTYLIFQNDIP